MKADRSETTKLLKTARGQIDGILKMIDEDKYCVDISHQLLACVAMLRKANREILRAHMACCVKEAFDSGTREDAAKKIDELIELTAKL